VAYCPNCSVEVAAEARVCVRCRADFTAEDGWKPAASLPCEPPLVRELQLEFQGSAREYFRIWAVNLCLTLLTAGVFSAWAKVRKKRYFYAQTRLDGTPFQYLGEPLLILRGRVIAVVLFLAYYASSRFFSGLLPFVLVLGLLLAPWVIARSAAFNARYSAYRNIRFAFDGNYLGAAFAIYWLGLIPLLVAGMALEWWRRSPFIGLAVLLAGVLFPWWLARLKRFLVRRSSYGARYGELDVTGGAFFKVYFVGGLIISVVGALAGMVFYKMFSLENAAGAYAVTLAAYAGYVLGFAYIQANLTNLVWNHARLGPLRFRSTLRARGLARLYLTNALAILCSLGLATPWAVIRTLKYRADNFRVAVHGDFAQFECRGAIGVAAAGAEVGEMFDLDVSL
jgi:uncharacterized membrane protein YjgN (DUF898 family)